MWFIWLRPLLISFLTYRSLLILICSNHFFSRQFVFINWWFKFFLDLSDFGILLFDVQSPICYWASSMAFWHWNEHARRVSLQLNEPSEIHKPRENPQRNLREPPRRTLEEPFHFFFFFNPIEPDNVPKVNSLQLCHWSAFTFRQ